MLKLSDDVSWLLDERFAGLLDTDEDRVLAAEVRDLFSRIHRAPSGTWRPLVDRLKELGAFP